MFLLRRYLLVADHDATMGPYHTVYSAGANATFSINYDPC